MCAPAAAALLLAALTALPCRGTDAETSSILNASNTTEADAPPTINKLYQMLHTGSGPNRTELPNFNYSTLNPIHSFNFYENFKVPDNTECCLDVESNNSNETSFNKTDVILDDVIKSSRKRRVVMNGDDGRDMPTPSPQVMVDRRRKPGDSGSSAPLLNYIFDTYTNTHQHRNDKVGTNRGIYAAAAPEIEALVGSTAHLDCKVDALHDKLVSWVRRKSDEDPMELLTTGTQQYTADDRYSSRFIPPDIWRLEVREVRPADAAHYDCQMPTHPPRTARVTLRVPEVSVRIVDGAGAAVSEQVCELGSTVALRCEVRGLRMEGGPALLWYRKKDLLNDDTTRGGISVRTEFGANGASSVLRVARVRGADAGRYTCAVARAPRPAAPPAHVILHVIKGESLAELHQGGGSPFTAMSARLVILVILHILVTILTN